MRILPILGLGLLSLSSSLYAQDSDSSQTRPVNPYLQRGSQNIGLAGSLGFAFSSEQKTTPGMLWGYASNLHYSYFVLDNISLGVQHTRQHQEHTHRAELSGYNSVSAYARAHLPFSIFSPRVSHYRSALFFELGYWEGSHYSNYAKESFRRPGQFLPSRLRFNALSLGFGMQLPLSERFSFQFYGRHNILGRGREWKNDMDAATWDFKIGLNYHFGKPYRQLKAKD